MKRLILAEILLLFLATTFKSDSTGWVQQTLPRNNVIVDDIFFTDSLTGWSTAHINPGFDTAFIFSTTNDGTNWLVQYQLPLAVLNSIQFVNISTGYAAGGTGPAQLYKTTNSGNNWINISTSMAGLGTLEDMFFINKDTGWVCDADIFGGLAKTTNGGINWTQQLNDTFRPLKIFFINKDTGWVGTNGVPRLYITVNGGINWTLQYTFTAQVLRGLFFANKDTGWTIFQAQTDTTGIFKTTNGGNNWQFQKDVDPFSSGLGGIYATSSKTGYIATAFSKIIKTTDGLNWYKQSAPNGGYSPIYFADSSNGWAGGSLSGNNFIIHTSDGGGPPLGITQISNEVPKNFKLFQNYPNPFNPGTVIKYDVRGQMSNVKLIVYDIAGREITTLVNQKQNPGTYQVDFDGSNLPSGVYFYQLTITNEQSADVYNGTKKMILVK